MSKPSQAKASLAVMLALFSSSAFAAEALEAASVLSYETALGATGKKTVQIKGTSVKVDGVTVDGARAMARQELLTEALKVTPTSNAIGCAAGVYRHATKIGAETKTEAGCIGEERFRILYDAFSATNY